MPALIRVALLMVYMVTIGVITEIALKFAAKKAGEAIANHKAKVEAGEKTVVEEMKDTAHSVVGNAREVFSKAS